MCLQSSCDAANINRAANDMPLTETTPTSKLDIPQKLCMDRTMGTDELIRGQDEAICRNLSQSLEFAPPTYALRLVPQRSDSLGAAYRFPQASVKNS